MSDVSNPAMRVVGGASMIKHTEETNHETCQETRVKLL